MTAVAVTGRVCDVDGCERPHEGRGWCHMHYQRVLRTGDVGAAEPASTAPHPRGLADGCTYLSTAAQTPTHRPVCLCLTPGQAAWIRRTTGLELRRAA